MPQHSAIPATPAPQTPGGRTLRQMVEAGSGWPDRATADAGLHACCSAVESLHRLGALHGQLTPDRVRVLDSGVWCLPLPLLLSDCVPDRPPLSPWLAPEQTEAGRAAGWSTGPWTDVHGIAALAHWVLTGSPPPEVGQAEAPGCWGALEQAEPDPLRRRAWRSALARRPADRLGSVAALRMALGWSEHHPPTVATPKPAAAAHPPPAPSPTPLTTRRPRSGLVALCGLVVSLSAVFLVLWINREPAATAVAATAPTQLTPPPWRSGTELVLNGRRR